MANVKSLLLPDVSQVIRNDSPAGIDPVADLGFCPKQNPPT